MRAIDTKNNTVLKLFSSVFLFVLLGNFLYAQTTYYSQGSANFSVTTNWNTARDGSGTNPGNFTSGDNFVIQNTHTITVDAFTNNLNDVTVETGGTLDMNGNSLDVNGNMTVDGTLQDLVYATSRNLAIAGNLSVSGTLSYVSIIFDGSTSQVISGAGTIDFYYVEFANTGGAGVAVSNTSSTQSYTQIIVSAGTFEPSNTWNTSSVNATTVTKISITGGTFTAQNPSKFTFTATHTVPPPVYATITISNTAGTPSTTTFYDLEFNSSATGNTLNFSNTNSANYQIDGTFDFTGSAKGQISTTNANITYGTSGTLKYSVTGEVDPDEWPTAGVPNVVLQSGTVTIPTGTFEVDNKLTRINGAVSLTGTLQYDPNNVTTLEYAPSPAAAVTVGGEWPSTNGPSNVTINNSGNTVTAGAAKQIPRTLSMTAGTLDMGANNLTILGTLSGSDLADGGTVTSTGTIKMGNGTGAQENQTISGNLTLSNLTIDKADTDGSNTVTISGNPTITNNFIVTNGDVVAQGTVTITSGQLQLDNASTFTVSSGALDAATIVLNSTSTFTTGGKQITNITSITAADSSVFEFNGTATETTPLSSVTFGKVNMNNTAGLNINGTVTINGRLIFSQDATVNTSSTNILIIGSGGSITGASSARFVNGPLRKAFASGAQSFTFPVGYSSTYHPATFEYLTNDVSTSVIEVEAVIGDPGGTAPSGISSIATSHHYTVFERGTAGTFTYNFTGHYQGTGFSPETRNQLLRQNGAGPTYAYDNSTAQTVNTTDKTVKINDALSALPTNDGIFAFGAGGAAVAWDGGAGDGLWSSALNWDSDAVPTSADDVTIDDAAGVTVTIGGTTSAEAQSLTIGNGSGSDVILVISSSSTSPLTVTNALTVNSEGEIRFSAANGDISAGSTSFDNASLVEYQSRTIPVDSYGNLVINGATGTSGTGTITVADSLEKKGSGSFTAANAFTVSGNYRNTAGTATYNGGLTFNGSTFTVASGTVSGTITFSGSSAQNIAGGGTEIAFTNLTLNNSNGLTLNNPISISGTLTLTSGLINTDETNVLAIGSNGAISNYDATHYINGPMKSSNTTDMIFPIGKNGEYRPVRLYDSGSSVTPTVRFEMFVGNPGGSPGTGVNNISTVRYWKGLVTNGSFNGRVELNWGSNDGVDGTLTDLVVTRSTTGQTGTYENIGNFNRSGDSNSGTIQSNDTDIRSTAADYFTFGSQTGDNSLPVELVSFEAITDVGNVTLKWETASELNNMGFNVYRALSGKEEEWVTVNNELIPGQGTYPNETQYSFTDNGVESGRTYLYKLESVSLTGVRVEEKVIEVAVPFPDQYALFNNYPNPFNPKTTIRFQLPETQQVKVVIYDIRGSVVKTLVNNDVYNAGDHRVVWDATDERGNRVASGMYIYSFQAGKFNKIGKMILLK